MIGIAALANLLAPSPIIGAFLFCFGLFAVVVNNGKLCTGMFGNCNKIEQWFEALYVCLINIIVAMFFGLLVKVCGVKIPEVIIYDNNLLTVAIKSILCGIMIHIGVKSYKKGSYITMLIAVMLFVLSGFEHCVANAFLIGSNTNLEFYLIIPFLINIAGNIIGAKFIEYFCDKSQI